MLKASKRDGEANDDGILDAFPMRFGRLQGLRSSPPGSQVRR